MFKISKMHFWGQTNLSLGAALVIAVALLSFVQSCTPAPQAHPLTIPTFTIVPSPMPTDTAKISGPPPTHQPTPTPKYVPPPAIIEAGQVWINSIDGAEMVSVPAGEFTMGSGGETAAEGPAHMVYLDAFYIDKYEISNTQYHKCVEAGICMQLEKRTYEDWKTTLAWSSRPPKYASRED